MGYFAQCKKVKEHVLWKKTLLSAITTGRKRHRLGGIVVLSWGYTQKSKPIHHSPAASMRNFHRESNSIGAPMACCGSRDDLARQLNASVEARNGARLVKERATSGKKQRHSFFSYRVVQKWNLLPANVKTAPSLNCFKTRLDEMIMKEG